MANFDHILKSGAKLHITTAPFVHNVRLTAVVKKAMAGRDDNEKVWDYVIFEDSVVEALRPIFQTVTYEGLRVTDELFDDLKLGDKATADYPEIAMKVIEANCTRFFFKTSSKSSEPEKAS